MDKISVVLIEDHDLTRVGLRTALQNHPDIKYMGETARGKEGLQLLKKEQPDVGIVDIGLPDLDGIELTKKFKQWQQQEKNELTKILILTLHDEEAQVMAAFAAGADSYCMKNINFNLLIEALKTTQQGNSWIDPAIARLVLAQAQQSKLPLLATTTKSQKLAPENHTENYSLTGRELEVLQLIVDGHSNAEIAAKLYITVGTVKTHVRNILNKLCADDRTQAAVRALRFGIVC